MSDCLSIHVSLLLMKSLSVLLSPILFYDLGNSFRNEKLREFGTWMTFFMLVRTPRRDHILLTSHGFFLLSDFIAFETHGGRIDPSYTLFHGYQQLYATFIIITIIVEQQQFRYEEKQPMKGKIFFISKNIAVALALTKCSKKKKVNYPVSNCNNCNIFWQQNPDSLFQIYLQLWKNINTLSQILKT